jgi:phage terminase small subunit
MPDLTDKQARFVEEYLVDLNATQAAVRAGYSEDSAASIGHENLRKPEIAQAISAAKLARGERAQVSAEWVLKRLVENVERAMQTQPVRDNEGSPTGEYRYEGNVANRALELVGKHLGMFTDKLQVGSDPNNPIVTRIERVIVDPQHSDAAGLPPASGAE